MKNKKVLIAIIIVLVLVIAAVAGILILKPFDKDNDDDEKKAKNETTASEKKEEKAVDYEEVLTAFAEACQSEDDMEAFVDKYVDFKSLWAAQNSDEPSDFADVYDNADKSDYEDEDFIQDAKDTFLSFVEEDVEIEISDVEEDGDFSSIGIDFWTAVKFTASSDGEELEMAAIFCEDKLVVVSTASMIDMLREADDTDDEDSDDQVKKTTNEVSSEISEQEVKLFNAQFESYEGDSLTASQVKALLEVVISSNSLYEEDGHFVSVYAYNVSGFDTTDLDDACFDEDVEAAATEISSLKSKLVSAKKYSVSFEKDSDGFIEEVEIEEL